jgi:DNA-binding MarR family transcriptional regulator
VREREGSLSAMEAFSLEIIRELNEPTVGQFAEFLNISQSNATYKVASLIKKGYIVKENSDEDRREYHLLLSDKYYNYIGLMQEYIATVAKRIKARFPDEDVEKLSSMLDVIADELMPEAREPLNM